MEIPDELKQKYENITLAYKTKGKPRTEWEYKVDTFYQHVNTPASIKKWNVYSRSKIGKDIKNYLASKGLKHDDDGAQTELYKLFNECRKARSFGGLFRHLTSPKKPVDNHLEGTSEVQ